MISVDFLTEKILPLFVGPGRTLKTERVATSGRFTSGDNQLSYGDAGITIYVKNPPRGLPHELMFCLSHRFDPIATETDTICAETVEQDVNIYDSTNGTIEDVLDFLDDTFMYSLYSLMWQRDDCMIFAFPHADHILVNTSHPGHPESGNTYRQFPIGTHINDIISAISG